VRSKSGYGATTAVVRASMPKPTAGARTWDAPGSERPAVPQRTPKGKKLVLGLAVNRDELRGEHQARHMAP
jgi:hypothetical protein